MSQHSAERDAGYDNHDRRILEDVQECAMTGLTRDEAGVLMTALDVFHPGNGADYEGVIRAVEAILADREVGDSA